MTLMLVLIWVVAATLLVFWSLGGWLLHALLTQGPALLGVLPGWIEKLPYPAVLERWLPDWKELLTTAAQAVQTGAGWAGDLGVVIVWVVWGFGVLLLLALAGLLSFAVSHYAPKVPSTAGGA